jgi:DNA replication protein DnaC
MTCTICDNQRWIQGADTLVKCHNPQCPAWAEYRADTLAPMLDQLQADMGKLARRTFENFCVDRDDLDTLVWQEQTYTAREQRQALADALGTAMDYAEQPSGWLYICGERGSGKSHLAAAIINELVAHEQRVRYAFVPDLLDEFRRGMHDGSADDLMDVLKRFPLLVLDDLGSENLSPWAEERLFILINYRNLHELPTVVTANARRDALPGRIGSRIAEMAEEIILPVSDYRKRGRS